MSSKKFCPNCGAETNADAVFCDSCGHQFAPTSVTQPEQPSQAPPSAAPIPSTGTVEPLKIYADDGERFLAYIIDSIIYSAIIYLIGLIFGQQWHIDITSDWANLTNNIPGIIASFIYFFAFEAFNKGRTLGKMMMKIQTVDEKFGHITYAQAALHVVGKVLFLPIDVIAGLILRKDKDPMEKNQVRITQRISHTLVIKEKRKTA